MTEYDEDVAYDRDAPYDGLGEEGWWREPVVWIALVIVGVSAWLSWG